MAASKQRSKAKIHDQYDESEANANYSSKIYSNLTHNNMRNDPISDNGEIIFIGDGWASFPDLDNFDSDLLLRVLTLKVFILVDLYNFCLRLS